jgi:hypothetical protein
VGENALPQLVRQHPQGDFRAGFGDTDLDPTDRVGWVALRSHCPTSEPGPLVSGLV